MSDSNDLRELIRKEARLEACRVVKNLSRQRKFHARLDIGVNPAGTLPRTHAPTLLHERVAEITGIPATAPILDCIVIGLPQLAELAELLSEQVEMRIHCAKLRGTEAKPPRKGATRLYTHSFYESKNGVVGPVLHTADNRFRARRLKDGQELTYLYDGTLYGAEGVSSCDHLLREVEPQASWIVSREYAKHECKPCLPKRVPHLQHTGH
jgi:hypothetical protein